MPQDFRSPRPPAETIGFHELRQACEISALREDLERVLHQAGALRGHIEEAVDEVRGRFAALTPEDLADPAAMAPLLQFAVGQLIALRDKARALKLDSGAVPDESRAAWSAAAAAPRPPAPFAPATTAKAAPATTAQAATPQAPFPVPSPAPSDASSDAPPRPRITTEEEAAPVVPPPPPRPSARPAPPPPRPLWVPPVGGEPPMPAVAAHAGAVAPQAPAPSAASGLLAPAPALPRRLPGSAGTPGSGTGTSAAIDWLRPARR